MTGSQLSTPSGSIQFYTGPLSMFGMKVEIALRDKGLKFERIEVPYSNAAGYSPKHPEVARINPKRQVPVIVHGDLELFDSTQIFEYLEDLAAEPPLWPSDTKERAQARLLEHKSDEVYFPHVIKLMGLQDQLNDPAAKSAIDSARDYYLGMERQIGDRRYLASQYTFADIAFYMAQLFGERMGAVMTPETPRLLAWRTRVGDRPGVRATMAQLVGYLRRNNRSVPAHLQGMSPTIG